MLSKRIINLDTLDEEDVNKLDQKDRDELGEESNLILEEEPIQISKKIIAFEEINEEQSQVSREKFSPTELTLLDAVNALTQEELKETYHRLFCVQDALQSKENEYLSDINKTKIIWNFGLTKKVRDVLSALANLSPESLLKIEPFLPIQFFALEDVLNDRNIFWSGLNYKLCDSIRLIRGVYQHAEYKQNKPLFGWVGLEEVNIAKLIYGQKIFSHDQNLMEGLKKYIDQKVRNISKHYLMKSTDGIENYFARMLNANDDDFTEAQLHEVKKLKSRYLNKLDVESNPENLEAMTAKVKSSKLVNFYRSHGMFASFINLTTDTKEKANTILNQKKPRKI